MKKPPKLKLTVDRTDWGGADGFDLAEALVVEVHKHHDGSVTSIDIELDTGSMLDGLAKKIARKAVEDFVSSIILEWTADGIALSVDADEDCGTELIKWPSIDLGNKRTAEAVKKWIEEEALIGGRQMTVTVGEVLPGIYATRG